MIGVGFGRGGGAAAPSCSHNALGSHTRRHTRQKTVCPRGEDCPCTHSLFEYWLHPERCVDVLCAVVCAVVCVEVCAAVCIVATPGAFSNDALKLSVSSSFRFFSLFSSRSRNKLDSSGKGSSMTLACFSFGIRTITSAILSLYATFVKSFSLVSVDVSYRQTARTPGVS